MAWEPFRFVHAADPRLDAPLVGLGDLCGEDLCRLAEDATLEAFQRVVEACLEHDAEFLLLTGQVWCDELTLRAWKALDAGCAALAEYGIRVIWAGGPPDLDDDLRRVLSDLSNLTLLPESDPDPVAIVREGRVIASLSAAEPASAEVVPASPSAGAAFQIRVLGPSRGAPLLDRPDDAAGAAMPPIVESAARCGINYLAVAGLSEAGIAGGTLVSRSFSGGLVHHPGAPQAVAPHEIGPRGCSLIDVPREGAVAVRFLPTSVVRWEHLRLGVDREMSRAQLVDRMQQQLLDVETVPGERLLCVHWLLVGSGPLYDALATTGAAAELETDVEGDVPRHSPLIRRHVYQLRPRAAHVDDPTLQEFLDHLERHGADGLDELCGEFTGPGAPPWWQRVAARLKRQDRRELLDTAGRLGRDWLLSQSQHGA